MRKYSLKKLLPWVIIIGIFLVLSVACFILMPLIDYMINTSATAFNNFLYVDQMLGALEKLFSFDCKRSIIAFSAFAASCAIAIAWFVVILVRKNYKKIIFWAIELVAVLWFVLTASLIFAGSLDKTMPLGGNWIFDMGFSKEPGRCMVGAILGVAAGALGALGMLLFAVSVLIDLISPNKKAEVTDEEVEAALEKRVGKEKAQKAPVMAEEKETKVARASAQMSEMDEDRVREIVHDECEMLYLRLLRAKAFEESTKEETVVVKEERVYRDESATDDEYYKRMIAELGMFQGRRVQEQPAPAPVAQPVKKPVPPVRKPAPAPVAPVVKPAPAPVVAQPAAEKIVRIPFEKRIVEADKVMKEHFNELKSEILSYGVKSRVSNSGDTFRLHTVTYVKVTIAGKSLKLYLALNPKDYKDSTMPVGDASKKSIYKEIPLVFKVKSELSMRRAKQLIAEAMAKGGLTQGEVEKHDWVKDIKNGNF